MPHKYEREIEEILRHMDQTEPHRGLGGRIRSFPQQSPDPRPRRGSPRAPLSQLDVLLVVGLVVTLLAAGMAFYLQTPTLLTGGLALLALAVLLVALVAGWVQRFRGPRAPRVWRGATVEAAPTPIRVHRRGLFGEIGTQVRIVRLKWRYWRSHERP